MEPVPEHSPGWPAIVTAILAIIIAAAIALYATSSTAEAAPSPKRASCSEPRAILPPPMYVKGSRAHRDQRKNITTALNVAKKMRAKPNHRVGLVAAIIAENSGWNKPWGHSSSVGLLQLLNIHGSPPYRVNPTANIAWRMRIRNSVGWFLRGARQVDPRGRLDPASLAGRVQRPRGGRSVYVPYVGEAQRIVAKYDAACVRR
jgi:hypothetical protein